MPICKEEGCKEDNPSNFYERSGRPKTYLPRCKYHHNKEKIKSNKKKKAEIVNYKGGGCRICGYNKCHSALELHHPNPEEKDMDFSRIRYLTSKEAKTEIDKCILLCANCHREVHEALDTTS